MKKYCVALLLCLASFAMAREVSIHVTDADLAIPLEGAQLRDPGGKSVVADSDGILSLTVPDGEELKVLLRYPGYTDLALLIGRDAVSVEARMSLSGAAIENAGIVVQAHRQIEESGTVGQSVAVTKEDIKATGEMGLIEDVMSSVKLLPGVGYSGGFDAAPSIRGGEPGELAAYLDGYYIEFPYYWGGAYSIFNPNMIESATLSHGIFPAENGNTISGLLQVESINPDREQSHYNLAITTSSLEGLFSIPLNGKGGIVFSGKWTYWEPLVEVAKLVKPSIGDSILTCPYIRDGSLKANYQFSSKLEGFLNGFYGADGIEYKGTEDGRSLAITSDSYFDYSHTFGFLSGGVHMTPSDSLLWTVSAGAGFNRYLIDYSGTAKGSAKYTQAFIDQWDNSAIDSDGAANGLINSADSFSVDEDTRIGSDESLFNIQARSDIAWDIGHHMVCTAGVEEMLYSFDASLDERIWMDTETAVPGIYTSSLRSFGIESANTALVSAVYAKMAYGTAADRFSLETGLRIDHFFIYSDSFNFNTIPTFNPRLNLRFGFLRDKGPLDELNLTVGTGLYATFAKELLMLEERWLANIDDYELGGTRSWSSVIGTEAVINKHYRCTLEGYVKYGFDRVYYNTVYTDTTADVAFHGDGQSIIWGADLMLRKIEGDCIDGWLSYSFNWARYRNPSVDAGTVDDGIGSAWYWPAFHRFHVLNLVLNMKPTDRFSVMTRLGFASGKPLTSSTSASSYAAIRDDGSVAEKWIRTTEYSDTRRSEFSIPIDVKLSWKLGKPDAKIRREFYVAAENLLVNIYSPKGDDSVDPYSGESLESSDLDFNIGIPFISIGYKIAF